MATTNAPWNAAHAGVLGQADAIEGSAQLNQLMGTHPGNQVYQGNAVVAPTGGTGGFEFGPNGTQTPITGPPVTLFPLNGYDRDQPFTMSGTTIGRVSIPLVPVGSGADVIVSLCNDNAGAPGTVITRTRIPASWINKLGYATGTNVPGGVPLLNATGSPLALAQFNAFRMGFSTSKPWPYPSVLAGTAAAASTFYGNYLYLAGGVNSSTAVANVFSAFCDTGGNMLLPVPQPALPNPADGSGKLTTVLDASNGSPVIVQAGGSTSFLGSTVATVNTAQINPATGVLSAWSIQTALPYTVQNQGMASYNGYVYVIGGVTSGGPSARTDVSFAQVQNTQITAWTAAASLPAPLQLPYCATSNGFLFVMGGANGSGTLQSTFYYAPINANGSLGAWLTGPAFPGTGDNLDTTPLSSPLGVLTSVNGCNMMAVTPNGIDINWANESSGGGGEFACYVQTGPVSYQFYGASTFGNYNTQAFALLPNISVPLPASGLSNGTLYHILIQSPTSDPNNYVTLAMDSGTVFPGNPKTSYRAKGSSTWTSTGITSIPLTVYDQTANGTIWHTWEDNGSRVTTVAYATTPDHRLLGVAEATCSPTQLNTNSGFQQGVSPWTATNGAVTQSSAQSYEGGVSGLLTPTGGFTTTHIQSEFITAVPGVSYTVSAWVYSPTGWGAVFPNVNFYTQAQSFISFGSASFNVPANTWTLITGTYTAPALTGFLTIDIGEASSPAAGNMLYVDLAMVYETYGGTQVSSVTAIGYGGTWPSSGTWPPTGTTQLA